MERENIRTQSAANRAANMASYDEYKTTPYYQTNEIDALRRAMAEYATDVDALRKQAEAQYNPTYQAELEALKQQTERQTQGYESQLAALGGEYERQRRRTNEDYDAGVDRLNNALLKRGMGRSSLVSTQGAHMEKQRGQALEDIGREERDAVNAINDRIALLTDQAARSRKRLADDYAQQLESRVNDLRQGNLAASARLQAQIAALQQQGYQAYQDWLMKNRAQELEEMEYEARYGGGKSSSSSSKKTGGSTAAKEDAQSIQKAAGYVSGALNKLKDRLKAVKESGGAKTGGPAGAGESLTEGNPSRARRVLW